MPHAYPPEFRRGVVRVAPKGDAPLCEITPADAVEPCRLGRCSWSFRVGSYS
jgi:hypothetical protein